MKEELQALGFVGEIRENYSTLSKTSYRIGGTTPAFILPTGLDDLRILGQHHRASPFPYLTIGKGSNLLIGDGALKTHLVSLEAMPEIFSATAEHLTVSAGTSLQKVIRYAREEGIVGFERLCGIPGNVGGSVRMNAGTHLGEIADLLSSFTVFDLETGEEMVIDKKDFAFSYRHNHALKPSHIVTTATFFVTKGEKHEIQRQIDETLKRRKETQPLDRPSCGSVFQNPPGLRAWDLIDKVGLRGHQIGAAQVSPIHPNWIVNLGGASAKDVRDLIALIQKKVWDQFQVELRTEVQFVG